MTDRTTTLNGVVVTEAQLREALGRLGDAPQEVWVGTWVRLVSPSKDPLCGVVISVSSKTADVLWFGCYAAFKVMWELTDFKPSTCAIIPRPF